jgi:hypothetical protein
MTHRFGGAGEHTTDKNQEEEDIPRHQQVIEALGSNFEQGLLLMKELVKDD